MSEMDIVVSNFFKFDIRIGTIEEATVFEKARKPAYILKINFGELGYKKSSARITHYYSPVDLVGQQVIAVVNLPPLQVANIRSEVFVLGVMEENDHVVLIQPGQKVENGLKIG
ncbi:MAG: tRNA-binding protein [Saprospiraceae bacterium]|nr:MAG: tRNA-binding protein [Saprospiraceae bacterium]